MVNLWSDAVCCLCVQVDDVNAATLEGDGTKDDDDDSEQGSDDDSSAVLVQRMMIQVTVIVRMMKMLL